MKKIASIIVVLSFCSSASAQPAGSTLPTGQDNPFLPPPMVPGFIACNNILYGNMNAIGQPYVPPELSHEYYEVLNCPAVFSFQARVNANAIAGYPPPGEFGKLWTLQQIAKHRSE